MTYRSNVLPTLDGVRALACLFVMFGHAMELGWDSWFVGISATGQYGVMLFFALSGFLMANHYMPGNATWRLWIEFTMRRFMRVYPAYIIVLLILWGWCAFAPKPWPYPWGFDATAVWRHATLQQGLLKFWTIPVEIKFYAVFPLLALLLLPLHPILRITACTLLWGALAIMASGEPPHNYDLPLLPFAPLFMGGVIMSLMMEQGWFRHIHVQICNAFIFLSLILITAAIYFHWHFFCLPMWEVWQYGYIAAPFTGLLVIAIAESTGPMRWLFANRASRFLGKISYSIYLLHFFIWSALKQYWPELPFFWLSAAVINIFCSWILYISVEKPLNTLAKKLSLRIGGSGHV